MEEQNKIDSRADDRTNRIVISCWLFLGFMYFLVFLKDIQDSARANDYNKVFMCLAFVIFIALMPVTVKFLYNRNNAFIRRSFKQICVIGFLISYILSYFSCFGQVVYPYAILMIMVITLYQVPRYVIEIGVPLELVVIGNTVRLNKLSDSNYTFSITMVFICIGVAFIITKGLQKINLMRMNQIQETYDEAVATTTNLLQERSSMVLENIHDTGIKITYNVERTDQMELSLDEISKAMESLSKELETTQFSTKKIQTELVDLVEVTSTTDSVSKSCIDAIGKCDTNLKSVVNQANKINMLSNDVNKDINDVVAQIEQVKGTIGIIQNIADETNLLSLNASIEAARAGEAGRGFAVVAQEIRSLSDNTNISIHNIQEIIADLDKKSDKMCKGLYEMQEEIANQTTSVNDVNTKLDEVSNELNVLIDGVSLSSDRLGKATQQNSVIVDSIANISAISEEVTANTESVFNMSKEVAEESNNIAEMNRKVELSMASK